MRTESASVANARLAEGGWTGANQLLRAVMKSENDPSAGSDEPSFLDHFHFGSCVFKPHFHKKIFFRPYLVLAKSFLPCFDDLIFTSHKK